MMITIRNDFTNREIRVNPSKPLTRAKLARWNRQLHAQGCLSGDVLGGRGPQDNPVLYAVLRHRADQVLGMVRDERAPVR